MNFEQTLQLNELHRRDLQRTAEHKRLVAEARPQQHSNLMLVALGRQMVNVGRKLQEMAHVDPTVVTTLQPKTR